jgi:hypothetical protein
LKLYHRYRKRRRRRLCNTRNDGLPQRAPLVDGLVLEVVRGQHSVQFELISLGREKQIKRNWCDKKGLKLYNRYRKGRRRRLCNARYDGLLQRVELRAPLVDGLVLKVVRGHRGVQFELLVDLVDGPSDLVVEDERHEEGLHVG